MVAGVAKATSVAVGAGVEAAVATAAGAAAGGVGAASSEAPLQATSRPAVSTAVSKEGSACELRMLGIGLAHLPLRCGGVMGT